MGELVDGMGVYWVCWGVDMGFSGGKEGGPINAFSSGSRGGRFLADFVGVFCAVGDSDDAAQGKRRGDFCFELVLWLDVTGMGRRIGMGVYVGRASINADAGRYYRAGGAERREDFLMPATKAKRKTIDDKIRELQARKAIVDKKLALKATIENAKKELRSLKK